MMLSCYYIGKRFTVQEQNEQLKMAREACISYEKNYDNIRTILINDILEIHAEEVNDNGLQSDSRQYRYAVCDSV